ncbi:hypothetical protein [Neotabrizicola sp. VNH66]|uniref:hypothetical protein n=1 Tax=Neotabrizicola sp. VNH66 TaxID=3400918 RepID=UPI003C12A4E5
MQRRHFLAGLAALAVAGPALADDDTVDEILRELEEDGYTVITLSNTWLGRVRILASGPRGTREIIVNPATGEVLRDLRRASSDKGGGDKGGGSGKGGDGSSHGGSDDDDDSDDDDSDDDSDGGGSGHDDDDD